MAGNGLSTKLSTSPAYAAAGLIKLGRDVGVALLPPRRKVIVMVMGNHSAGKSSFINWYEG